MNLHRLGVVSMSPVSSAVRSGARGWRRPGTVTPHVAIRPAGALGAQVWWQSAEDWHHRPLLLIENSVFAVSETSA